MGKGMQGDMVRTLNGALAAAVEGTAAAERERDVLAKDLETAKAAVAAAKSLDKYFKDHVEKSLARIDQNNNSNSK